MKPKGKLHIQGPLIPGLENKNMWMNTCKTMQHWEGKMGALVMLASKCKDIQKE